MTHFQVLRDFLGPIPHSVTFSAPFFTVISFWERLFQRRHRFKSWINGTSRRETSVFDKDECPPNILNKRHINSSPPNRIYLYDLIYANKIHKQTFSNEF